MLAQSTNLKQEHEALIRTISLVQRFDPNYTGPVGFDLDYNTWLANLTPQVLPDDDILDDMADAMSQQMTGIPAF